MPFNGSGTFSIINTFVPNTTILSAAVNQNFTDIATGLSDCLTRDGQAGMSAVFKAIAGSVSAPGISFTSDPTSGLYLPATGSVGLVSHSLGIINNSNIFRCTAAAVQAGGSNYAVGDTIVLTGGTVLTMGISDAGAAVDTYAILKVATLSGSAVATVTVLYTGFYTAKPTNPVSQGSTSGSGTGATFNLTFNDPTSSDYRQTLTTEAGTSVIFGRLGATTFASALLRQGTAYDFAKAMLTFGSGLSLSSSTNPPTLTTTLNPTLVPGYINGLTLSTAGSSGTMSIAAGVANDSTNTVLMNLASAISKTTASWAVGTGNGGLDTGSIANSTWYHFYEIERVDTGVVDVVFSTNATSPTLPTNYTIYRGIGSGLTDGSAHWTLFTQTGDTFIWSVTVGDLANAAVATTNRTNQALTVPLGKVVTALFRVTYNTGAAQQIAFFSPQESDQAASATTGICDLFCGTGQGTAGDFARLTNTSRQIAYRANGTAANGFSIGTYGWIDTRGKS